MERNWLIRTYNKQILGPVSKQKLLEFIQKGSVGLTDEVTSGNGYWFSLKERDLVEKYLHGDIPQSFNPVSESKSVFVFRKNQDKTTSLNSSPPNNRITDHLPAEKVILPAAEDLEYPDMEGASVSEKDAPDITVFTRLPNLPNVPEALKPKEEEAKIVTATPESSSEQLFPQNDDLEYPDMPGDNSKLQSKAEEENESDRDFTVILPPPEVAKPFTEEPAKIQKESKPLEIQNDVPLTIEKKAKLEVKPKPPIVEKLKRLTPITPPAPTPPTRAVPKELEKRNDNYLFVLFFVLIVILFGIFYYYREILNKPLPI